jgi:hypothetical protein
MNSTVYNRPGALPAMLREAIKKAGAEGISAADLHILAEGALRRTVQTALSRMAIEGSIFAIGRQGNRRYFATAADAARAKASDPVPAPPSEPKRRLTNPALWTAEEDAIVRKHYPANGGKKTTAMLPGRSAKAINARAALLKVPCDITLRWANHGGPNKAGTNKAAGGRKKHLENIPIGQQPERVAPTVSLKKVRGPADQPGEATLHPNFKFTSCPAPAPVLRTNTFSQY